MCLCSICGLLLHMWWPFAACCMGFAYLRHKAVSRNVSEARPLKRALFALDVIILAGSLIRQAGRARPFRHFYSGPALGRPRVEATTTLLHKCQTNLQRSNHSGLKFLIINLNLTTYDLIIQKVCSGKVEKLNVLADLLCQDLLK